MIKPSNIKIFVLLFLTSVAAQCQTKNDEIYEECYNEPSLRDDIFNEVIGSKRFEIVVNNSKRTNKNIVINDSQTAIFGLERNLNIQGVNIEIVFGNSPESDSSNYFTVENLVWLGEHIYLEASCWNQKFRYLFNIHNCNAKLIDEGYSIID